MLPTSHQLQIGAQPAAPHLLAEAFSDFISASARLELSYRDLQAEVQQLSRELADRNEALRNSHAQNQGMRESLEDILESMPCGVLVLDSENRIRLANPEASRLLGTPLRLGLSLEELAVQRNLVLPTLFEPAGEGTEQEVPWTGSSSIHWLAVRQRELSGWIGSGTSLAGPQRVLILRDVSLKRRLETEREAARTAVALGETAAILAHEIRNPLASMELFADLIQDAPEQVEEWLSHLRAGLRSLSGTVNNVLALHGDAAPPLEKMELRGELELAVEFLRPLADQARIALSLVTSPEACFIRGNRTAVRQVILNLCTNALRYTPAGGSVQISLTDRGGAAIVHVEDTGCGLAAASIPELFHHRYSGSGRSSGLGLAVCGRLMRLHGGTVSVESRPGAGSRFTLEFPAL